MELIVISPPENSAREADNIRGLFDAGLQTLHLRKPEMNMADFEQTLRELPVSFYKRIVIHSHYKLVEKYNLKGIHLTSWFMREAGSNALKDVIAVARKRRLTVSGSFHTLDELKNPDLKLDYVFLGPVFNSISKEGYNATINLAEISQWLKEGQRRFKVIALGGIDETNLEQVKDSGFDGAALLGAIWNAEDVVAKFNNIRNQ